MLAPQANEIRDHRLLDGLWRFAPDAEKIGEGAGWQRAALRSTTPIPVPASFNDLFTDAALRDLIGDVWYELNAISPFRLVGLDAISCCVSARLRTTLRSGSMALRLVATKVDSFPSISM